MKNWLKKYWAELLVFGAILGTLLLCCAPSATWINTDSDGIHYVYSAKYLYPAHKTSAPLFLLMGHAFLWLPFGTEFWRMSFMSVLATTVSTGFIYLIIKHYLWKQAFGGRDTTYVTEENYKQYKQGKLYALIGALIFGGSALVISQSTIVETYALVTMFGLGAYYFAVKEKWLFCALMLGAGGAVHLLIGIPIMILLIAYKGLRRWKYVGTMAAFLLFYLYIPITAANAPINMWGNVTMGTFLADIGSTAQMLGGGLSIWDLPKRILDAVGVLGVSLGLSLIPIGYFLVKRKWYKEPLFWLFILPVVGYVTNLAPQTYVYMLPVIGFGAVIAGIGLARMRPYWKWAVLSCAIGLLVFNANYFDIGRTLDPKLSATKYYNGELSKVPDGEILVAQQGWEWACVPMYNKENSRDILVACVGTLPSLYYQDSLRAQGIRLEDYPDESIGTRPTLIALSIIELNENVWTTQPTDMQTYGAEVITAKGNEHVIEISPHAITDGSTDMVWRWQPSNPYDVITGAIEVEEWIWLVYSNYTVLTFVMLGTIGAVPCWIGYMIFIKKRKWSLKRRVKEVWL